ncbi:MAG: aminotransferase class IV [Deltaproteobacteria bacterium]|nr:aminotransferase class IV [Deltaproteobacteria bacterium]
MSLLVNINGKYCKGDQARVSVFDRGFLYGDSVYEVVRTYGGIPFAVSEHLDRFVRSAARLEIQLPERSWLEEQIDETIKAAGNPESYCRIIVTRGSGPITLDPTVARNPMTVLIVKELEPFADWMYTQGIKVAIPTIRRNHPAALDPAIKSGNYLNSVLALGEAKRAGFDDALLLGTQGRITEATSANVFLCRQGTLYTPTLQTGILQGVTRGLIIQIAKQLGIECKECDLYLEDLEKTDEVMLTGTLKEVMPVVQVGQQTIGDGSPGPLTHKLKQSLRTLALARVQARSN